LYYSSDGDDEDPEDEVTDKIETDSDGEEGDNLDQSMYDLINMNLQ